jgi:multidrug efflux system membrane fusion protein
MFRVLLIGLAAVFGMSAYIWTVAPPPTPAAPPAPPPVSVAVFAPERRDVPVILSGIGTVQSLNAVQIRSRVDGTLESVNFTEGQEVKQGDVLATIDPRLFQAALDQAKAKKAQDEAQLANDMKDLERTRTLAASQVASQQTFDQLQAKVTVGRALVAADEAAIKTAETNLGYTRITAPFNGRVGLRNVDPGNIVRANDTAFIATLTQHQPISVVFTLPESQLGAIRDGLKAGDLPAIAFDQDARKPIATGKVDVIDNQVDQATGTIRLRAVFANTDEALWPGQYTPVQVQVNVRRSVIAVPTDALQRGPNGLYVWVAKADRRAAMAPVDAGIAFQNLTVIERGINPGDQVIVSNQYRLRPNTVVTIDTTPVASATERGGRS